MKQFLKKKTWIFVALFFALVAFYFVEYIDDDKSLSVYRQGMDKRVKADKPIMLKQYIAYYKLISAYVAATAFFLLALTAKFWFTATKSTQVKQRHFFTSNGKTEFFLPIVLIIAFLSGLFACNRIHLSFWYDEDLSIRNYTWGEFKVNKDDSLRFEKADWRDTLYNNKHGNNHILFSVFQRTGFEIYRKLTGNETIVREWIAKLPALIFGIASIVLVAILIKNLGCPLAGIGSAVWLAFHPWHFRYLAEARGYTLLLVLTSLYLIFAIKALQNGKWRNWIFFGLFSALSLYTFFGSLYVVALTNIAIIIFVLISNYNKKEKISQIIKSFVISCSTAVIFLFFALPAIKQGLYKMSYSGMFRVPMTLGVYLRTWSEAFTGMYFRDGFAGSPISISLKDFSLGLPALIILTCLLIGSIFYFAKKFGKISVLFILPFFSFVLLMIHSHFLGVAVVVSAYIYPTLIFMTVFMSIALIDFGKFLAKKFKNSQSKLISLAPFATTLILLFCLFYQKNISLMNYSMESYRTAVEATRWQSEPPCFSGDSKVITISFWRDWKIYDPRIKSRVRNASQLNELIAKAKKEGKKLYVVVSNMPQAKVVNKDIIKMLNDKNIFKPLKVIYGMRHRFTLYPYELL